MSQKKSAGAPPPIKTLAALNPSARRKTARKQSAPEKPADDGRNRPVGRWGEREAGILAVALELFRKEGYENCSMARVAAAAGLSEGTLYNYFQDKLDLVLRVTLVSLELRVAAAVRVVDAAVTMRDGVQQLIALHLSAVTENGEIYRIWMREIRASKSYSLSPTRDALARFANQFVRLLAKFGLDDDLPNGLTPQMMREMVFGGSEHIGMTALFQDRVNGLDVEAVSAMLADAYLRIFEFEEPKKPQRKAKKKTG